MNANPSVSTIIQALVAQNSVNAEILNFAVNLCQKNGGSLLDYLLKNKHLAFQDLQTAVQNLYQLSCFNPALDSVDPEYSKVLPVAFMVTHQVCPLGFDESRKQLNILMVDPDNLAARDQISLITGYRVRPVFATPEQMETLLKRLSMGQNKSDDALARLEEDETLQEEMLQTLSGNDIESQIANEDSPIVKLVNAILTEAYFQNASDVHIEPNRENLVIRYRIDGILREAKVLPKTYSLAFVSRVKVASGMNIAEKRIPQDGRLSLMIQGQRLDMRVNTLACQFGESVVLRLLKASATAVGLDKLGIGPEEVRRLIKMIRSPYGIILVTGPTGSGKTTTLYSALREINAQTS
ncbi:MAG: Flp pilus assembly complex ATPase component TadA, partial [Cyanobacteria bacterium]|nr:Flp pilus assembly complex ATPase component TadA [Cyanobacteriota bacterium]